MFLTAFQFYCDFMRRRSFYGQLLEHLMLPYCPALLSVHCYIVVAFTYSGQINDDDDYYYLFITTIIIITVFSLYCLPLANKRVQYYRSVGTYRQTDGNTIWHEANDSHLDLPEALCRVSSHLSDT